MVGAVLVVLLGAAATLLHGSASPHGGAPGSRPPTLTPSPPAGAPPATSTPAARSVTVIGAGDVLLHPSVWRQAATDAAATGRPGYDFGPIFAGAAPAIAAADLAICHLETPLGPPGGPFTGYPLFSVPPQVATALRQAGYDTCSTASNHTLDGGEQGIYRTLDTLDAAGLRHAGSYRNAAAQHTPTILDVHGVRVAHLSYTSGFNGLSRPPGKAWVANLLDPAAVLDETRRARSAGADIVVASLHWGIEYDHRASPDQVALARRLLGPGKVDLILGSHTHVVQPLEKVNGAWVAYGMGNHIARQSEAYPDRREGVMPRFTFTEQAPGRWAVTKAEAVPTWIELAPQIRIVNLPAALASPTTPPERRQAYQAAQQRIIRYLQARGVHLAMGGG